MLQLEPLTYYLLLTEVLYQFLFDYVKPLSQNKYIVAVTACVTAVWAGVGFWFVSVSKSVSTSNTSPDWQCYNAALLLSKSAPAMYYTFDFGFNTTLNWDSY